MKLVFDDQTLSSETLRALGYTVYGGAHVGEVPSTADGFTESGTAFWWAKWNATATDCADRGHLESARCAYPRASN